MKSVEKSARSVDEAIAAALEELGVPSDRVAVEVLDEGRTGFLGIGARPARVRVTVKETRRERVERFLNDLCDAMRLTVRISVTEDEEYIRFDVTGPEAGILIGHHGQTLDALQYLVNLVASKATDGDGRRVLLDVEGYRKRREETLTRLATRMAERVARSGDPVVLEPMSAHERRVIHLALQNNPKVTTGSQGEEPFRRVVIQPKR